MHREDAFDCQIGDWVHMMEMPEWETGDSPHSWESPDGSLWHFGFTCVPNIDEEMREVGRDFVWMRFDPAIGPPPPPQGVSFFRTVAEPPPADPADWWRHSSE